MRTFARIAASHIAVVAALTATCAHAQSAEDQASGGDAAIKEIIVTAQKRGENIQNVPIAITAITGAALQAKGVANIQDIANSTPNLYAAPYSTSPATLFLFMRGMGVGDPMQVTKDSSIGVYENGIFNPRPQAIMFELADPERVEILRGPQGTLYGRNTTGGAVNVVSRAPSGEAGIRQLASYGSRNQYRSITNIDMPAIGNLKLKGTIVLGGDDGYTSNIDDPAVAETNDYGVEDHVGGRFAALWEPSDAFSANYSFTRARINGTPMLLQAPAQNGATIIPGIPYASQRDTTYRPVFLPKSRSDISDHGLTLEFEASDSLTLRSITGIRHLLLYTYGDTQEAYGVSLTSTNDIDSRMFSQEFQAIGTAWDDRIKYAAGLYYYRERVTHNVTFNQPGSAAGFDIRAKSLSKAAYLQVALTPPILDDRLDLIVGGRQTEDERSAARDASFNGFFYQTDVRNNQKFRRFNPSFTATYRWTDHISTYAKVGTGYRAGGSSETTPDFTETFGPESLTSYEVGLKAELFDRRLRANIAGFYNRYKDIQLDLTLTPDPTITQTLNAGRAHLEGIEADITAALTRDLVVNVNYAYLHTKIQDVRAGPGQPNIADLFRIPYAPKSSVNVSADWKALRLPDSTVIVHVDYDYKSAVWGTAGSGPGVSGNEFYRAPGATLVNARITLERELFGKPATLALFSRNLFNSRHVKYASAVGAQTIGYFYANQAYAAPRTVGVEVSFGF